MQLDIISPSKAGLLACTAILSASLLASVAPVLASVAPVAASAFSIGFVYNDLLAHPQYHVQLLNELVPVSAVGTDRLRRGNAHHQQSTVKPAPQIETVKDESQFDGSQDQEQHGDGHTAPAQAAVELGSSMIMTDADGQRWACSIPLPQVQEEAKPEPEKTPLEVEEEKRRSVKRGLELLDHLTGRCLLTGYGYWTYEYCHKKRIRQFNAHNVNGKWEPTSEAATHVLAIYQPPQSEIQAQPNVDSSVEKRTSAASAKRVPTSTELGVSNERKYLVQHWSHGDICDLTGEPRKVEVQFQCANVDDRIQLVEEPSTCTYIIVIYSSSLCKDVAFELIPAPEANKIDCRRIVTDEQYQQSKTSSPGAIEDGLGLLFQESDAQVKFGQQAFKEESASPLDKASAAGARMAPGFKEMASLIDGVEAATRRKQLDDLLAEFELYFQALKSGMSEAQIEALEQLGDLAEGKTDQNGQHLEIGALLEALLGAEDHSGKAKEKSGERAEPKAKNNDGSVIGNKKDKKVLLQLILDSFSDEGSNAAPEHEAQGGTDKDAQPTANEEEAQLRDKEKDEEGDKEQ